MKKAIFAALGGLALLAGCGQPANNASNIPAQPKWKGPPYHVAFDTKAPKPNPAGITLPAITYTANPDALEKRICLVVHFDASGAKRNQAATDQPVMDQMILPAADISGAEGALPADYMDQADKGLAKLLAAYCIKGKVKLTVALTRSSINPQAGDAELNEKRLSDWLPVEVDFKNPHPKC